MKAVLQKKYGSPDVLKFIETTKPIPADDQVLIKVQAVGLNAADWRLLVGDPVFIRLMRLGKGRIPGSDMAGTVKAVGMEVRQFQPEEEVYGDIFFFGSGAFAEYVCVPEKAVARKPSNLSFEEAAAVPMAAVTALQALRDVGGIQPGQKVLIHGASGGVGTFAVQLARAFGAEVTAVCSTSKMEKIHTLGADHVIDYTREDFTRNGQHYDLILAANGYRSIFKYRRALTPRGVYVMAGGSMGQIFQALLFGGMLSRETGKKLSSMTARPSQKDLLAIRELIEAGKVTPVIDRCYPYEQIQDAFHYLGGGHALGKVVIRMEPSQ